MSFWNHAQNPILRATEGSFKNAIEVTNYHVIALEAAKSDPYINSILNKYIPVHRSFEKSYQTWLAQGGSQQGETLSLKQMLQRLTSDKIRDWDIIIQGQYNINSPTYKKLLPNRRGPFQTGTQVKRINAVKALSDRIGDDSLLKEVKDDIDAFYTKLQDVYKSQRGSKNTTTNLSVELENARVEMCTAQFVNLGSLIQNFPTSPEKIESFFNLKIIRNIQQVTFRGHLEPGEVYTIVKHSFSEDDQIYLSNLSMSPLKFYLANKKNALPNAAFIELINEERTIDASTLGHIDYPYLMVYNTDPKEEASFIIELL